VGEQHPPQVGAGLAEALHVDVDLDVGAQHVDARHAAHHRQPPLPRPRQHHGVVEGLGQHGDGRLPGRVEGRERRDRADAGPRSASAVSPRTTRLTSSAATSSASHTGHHGQRRHSSTREGRASAGPPVAAAVATAARSARRASYSASVDRPPGQ
jgi:hypothetical protein